MVTSRPPKEERKMPDQEIVALRELLAWDPLESTCRHASLSIL